MGWRKRDLWKAGISIAGMLLLLVLMAWIPSEELQKRDKMSLDIFWLRDESLEDADALPSPEVLAASIVEDLQAALEQFAAIAEDVGS